MDVHVHLNTKLLGEQAALLDRANRQSRPAHALSQHHGFHQAAVVYGVGEIAFAHLDLHLRVGCAHGAHRVQGALAGQGGGGVQGQRRMGDVLAKLARFSPDFMSQGRGQNVEGEREAL